MRNDDPGKSVGFSTWDKQKLEEMMNNYDKEMLTMIGDLYGAVNSEKLDLNGITKAVDALTKFNSRSEYNYLNNLLMPEKCKGVKIPSPIPVPSCSFQLHNCVTLSPNSSGNLGVIFNPNFLCSSNWYTCDSTTNSLTDAGGYDQDGNFYASTSIPPDGTQIYQPAMATTLMVNNSNTLTGTQADNNWIPVNINQAIPPVYDQYRLVSASIVVKYIGRLDIISGVIGGAIIFDENPTLNGSVWCKTGDGTTALNALNTSTSITNLTSPGLSKYGNFDLAMDSFYHQENLCLEGIRQLYFPIDNSYEEYTKIFDQNCVESYSTTTSYGTTIQIDPDNFRSGFNFFIYTMGAPQGSCLKFDIYCNFECLPNASFLNYMPVSVSNYGISNQEKKEAISIIQEKPIMKSNEYIEVQTPASLGWKGYLNNMAKRFSGYMPSIKKIVDMGINYFVPKLKPAIAIASSLINSVAQQIPKTENLTSTNTTTTPGMTVE